jgi:hypothetical protein
VVQAQDQDLEGVIPQVLEAVQVLGAVVVDSTEEAPEEAALEVAPEVAEVDGEGRRIEISNRYKS